MLLDLYFFHAEESMAGSVFAQQISGGHYLRLRAVALALRRPPLQFVVPDCRGALSAHDVSVGRFTMPVCSSRTRSDDRIAQEKFSLTTCATQHGANVAVRE